MYRNNDLIFNSQMLFILTLIIYHRITDLQVLINLMNVIKNNHF